MSMPILLLPVHTVANSHFACNRRLPSAATSRPMGLTINFGNECADSPAFGIQHRDSNGVSPSEPERYVGRGLSDELAVLLYYRKHEVKLEAQLATDSAESRGIADHYHNNKPGQIIAQVQALSSLPHRRLTPTRLWRPARPLAAGS